MKQLIPIGSEVKHLFHGVGTVIAHNDSSDEFSMYSASAYPYVVQFLNGYSDYYADSDLTVLK